MASRTTTYAGDVGRLASLSVVIVTRMRVHGTVAIHGITADAAVIWRPELRNRHIEAAMGINNDCGRSMDYLQFSSKIVKK